MLASGSGTRFIRGVWSGKAPSKAKYVSRCSRSVVFQPCRRLWVEILQKVQDWVIRYTQYHLYLKMEQWSELQLAQLNFTCICACESEIWPVCLWFCTQWKVKLQEPWWSPSWISWQGSLADLYVINMKIGRCKFFHRSAWWPTYNHSPSSQCPEIDYKYLTYVLCDVIWQWVTVVER